MNIYEMVERTPDNVDERLRQQIERGYEMTVDPTAQFGGEVTLGYVKGIGDLSIIDYRSFIDDYAEVGRKVVLGRHVSVETSAKVGSHSVIGDLSSVERRAVLGDGVIVGEKVRVGAEAQISSDTIVPTQATIVTLGRFGASNRTVTIHGSDVGPRFSAGCQTSIDWERFEDRVMNATETTLESAGHYQQHLEVFNAIGATVQAAYDREANLVEELRQRYAA